MKHCRQIAPLIAFVFIGLVGARVMADDSKNKPKLVQANQARIQVGKPRRSFANLLQEGQWVTLYRIRQESPSRSQYQVRIVTKDQIKQVEDVIAVNRKELEDYDYKTLTLKKQMQSTTNTAKRTELRNAQEELRRNYKPRQLPSDLRYAGFYKISEVGRDYVGFERNGVETFHRLSSIFTIIRGVKIKHK